MTEALFSPQPLVAGMARDPCRCVQLRVEAHPGEHGYGRPKDLCLACDAWAEGWVLIDGERVYRVQRWLAVHERALKQG